MKRPPPPLNMIRSFECAARHMSFTKAARELGYTQAAISTHVRALEKYIGRPLFTRNARSLALTEIGEAFLPTLRQALNQIDSATEAVVTASKDCSVVLACPMSLAENWLPPHLASFRETNPDTEILVHGTVWDSGLDEIADIVISVLRDDEVRGSAVKLWDETLLMLAAPDLAGRVSKPGDLAGFQCIVVSGRQEYWSLFSEALEMDLQATAPPCGPMHRTSRLNWPHKATASPSHRPASRRPMWNGVCCNRSPISASGAPGRIT